MTGGVLGLTIGALVGTVAWLSLDMVFSEERQVAKRLRALSAAERLHAGEVEPLTSSFRERVLRPSSASLADVVRSAMPHSYLERLERRTRMAGHPGGVDAGGMLALKVICSGALLALGGIYGYLMWENFVLAVFVGLLAAVSGWFAPDVWLERRITKRKEAIRRELPDMLDMLMIAIEAGLGFDAAVAKYVRHRHGPLAEEFSAELREVHAGMSRREAMRNLADRCDVFELSTFCMAMVQADVFGVSVGNVLRTQSQEMRLKRRQHAEELAQKIPAKMVFPLVFFILPATLIVLGAPAILTIADLFGMGS